MMNKLSEELAALSPAIKERITQRGFREARLTSWAGDIGKGKDERNRLKGAVEPPKAEDLARFPEAGSADHARCREKGLAVLRQGKVALCVLAGGMATRMGGVVKALVEALPGHTFLELRLAEQRALEKLTGHKVPLWLMTSEATCGPIKEALGARLDGKDVAVFEQCVSLRLTPEGGLFHESDGDVSVYATGHGDLPEALAGSGLLARFIEERGDGWVWIANLDNLGATVDPALLGFFLEQNAALGVEVVDKVGTDKGGVPVRWNGKKIIAEEFRLPTSLDPATIRVFNTNTFLVKASALRDLAFDFTFVEVEKNVEGKKAVQFERLVGEITVPLEPAFLCVPRDGVASRFLPVKDHDELAKRRPEIEAVVRERGILT